MMYNIFILLSTTLYPVLTEQGGINMIKSPPAEAPLEPGIKNVWQDTPGQPAEPKIKNYWQDPIRIEEYKQSKFKAFANTSDLNNAIDLNIHIANEYETVRQYLVKHILDETESLDLTTLETNETARLCNNNTLNNMIKKFFYFKSKYYFDINNWYYDIVFNMRKYFKDKHKYLGSANEVKGLVDMYQILNYERDIDLLFNNLAFKYRDKISSEMKSMRIKFYYALNTISSENCEEHRRDFRDIMLFAMGKQET